MKKILCAMLALPLMLTACVAPTGTTTGGTGTTTTTGMGTATTIGMNVFKAAVDNQCRTELNANNAWRTIALTMTAEQQEAVTTKVCGCVSEKAPQNVTVVELTQAAIDPNARAQIVATTVAKTLNACYSEFVKR